MIVSVDTIIGAVIGIVVAVSLIPAINEAVENANLTGTNATLAGLITTVFVAGIITVSVRAFMHKARR